MSSPAFYLGRKQKVFGPLTAAEVEALRHNGQIDGYSWIWTPGAQEWTALDAAPPAPPAQVTAHVTSEPVPSIATTRPAVKAVEKGLTKEFRDTRIAKARAEAFRAILFDGRNAVTAWVSEASAEGCEIHASEQGPDPFFVQKANAMIHLHEVATGRTTKIPVSVSDVYRQDHQWVYKVRWSSVPSLFTSGKAA